MIKMFFKNTVLLALIAALGLASLPFVSVAAQGAKDPTPPPTAQASTDRLEKVWAHQLKVYERMGKVETVIDRVQNLIDRATAKGKDASAVQTALNAFKDAVKNAQPIYESMKGVINSHQGFDANGAVTDLAKALETVKDMHAKILAVKTAMNGTGQALHQAVLAFRAANPRPVKTAAP